MDDILDRARRTITPRQSYMRSGDDDLMAEMVAEIERLQEDLRALAREVMVGSHRKARDLVRERGIDWSVERDSATAETPQKK